MKGELAPRTAVTAAPALMGAWFEPGTRVGAQRWPHRDSHPDAWGEPWTGVVLTQTDVRAWTGTIAFSGRPTQAQTNRHVAACHAQGLLLDEVPVLWHFGDHTKVYWQPVRSLMGAAADRAQWAAARDRVRLQELARARLRAAQQQPVAA